MTLLMTVRILGIPLLMGVAVLLCAGIRFREHRLSFLGWSWAVGGALAALVTLAWLSIGLDAVHPWLIDGVCIGLSIGAIGLGRRRGQVRVAIPPQARPGWERALFLTTVVLVLAVSVARLVLSSRLAILSNDEAIFWSFRAKILLEAGGFNPAYIENVLRHRLPNAEYPLLNPMLQTWVFAHVERITHVVNRVPIQLYSFSLLLVLAGALQRVCRPALAAVLLILVATMPETMIGAKLAQSDILVCCGLVVAFDAWLRAQGEQRGRWLGLAAFGVSLVLWAKLDGLILSACGVAALLLSPAILVRGLRGSVRSWGWALLPVGTVVLSWTLNRVLQAKPAFGREDGLGVLIGGFFERFAERGPMVLEYFVEEVLFRPQHSHFVLLAFLVLVLAGARLWPGGALRIPTLTLLIAIPGYLAVFLIVPSADVNWHLATAAQRLFFQLAVPMTLWLGVVFGAIGGGLASGPANAGLGRAA